MGWVQLKVLVHILAGISSVHLGKNRTENIKPPKCKASILLVIMFLKVSKNCGLYRCFILCLFPKVLPGLCKLLRYEATKFFSWSVPFIFIKRNYISIMLIILDFSALITEHFLHSVATIFTSRFM